MYYERLRQSVGPLYHYTRRQRAEAIMREGCIRPAQGEAFVFFAPSEEASRLLFRELMEKPVSYIGADRQVHRQIPQDPADYVILKVTLQKPGNCYRFHTGQAGFDPYASSILHWGEAVLERAEMIPMHKAAQIKQPSRPVRRSAAAAAAALMLWACAPQARAEKESWLNHADISWYTPLTADRSIFYLDTPEELAGVARLVEEGNNFEGKSFMIENDLDLTAYRWEGIPQSFKGVIEGLHRITLSFSQESVTLVYGKLNSSFDLINVSNEPPVPPQIPATGDESRLTLWAGMLLAATSALGLMRKRERGT
ncbi:MAG: LPXTG cell wall anchor domain-containing protein [Clostridia bacterium]|nr:LPXTG cell wall anchor domain-containing protein [Clostridia bacterium]